MSIIALRDIEVGEEVWCPTRLDVQQVPSSSLALGADGLR